MTTLDLRPDCARCAALCCIGLAFDRSSLFAYDKPAGEPCRHLDGASRCRIHATLQADGFGGCVAYDCLGAGQHVTQQMFGGRSWRDDPELLEPMMAALKAHREVRELMVILAQARTLPVPAEVRATMDALVDRLETAALQTTTHQIGALVEDARRFLRTLRPFAPRDLTPARRG